MNEPGSTPTEDTAEDLKSATVETSVQTGTREPRLAERKIATILRLTDEGKNQTEIAKLIRCDPSTVSRTLQKFADVRPMARRLLESRATALARTVLKTKNADVALKALAKLDVVREDSAGSGPQVMVVLGASVDPVTGCALSPSVSRDLHSITVANKDDSVA